MALIIQSLNFTDKQGREFSDYRSNVLDLHDVEIVFRAEFNLVLGSNVSIVIEDNTFTILNGPGSSVTWEQLGVSVGTAMTGTITDGTNSLDVDDFTIEHVEGNYVVLTGPDLPFTPFTADSGEIIFDINPEAFEFMVNLVPKDEPGTEFSLIDGNVNKYTASEVDTLTVGGSSLNFQQEGILSGGGKLLPTINRVSDVFGSKTYRVYIPDFRNFLYTVPGAFAGNDCTKFWILASVIPINGNESSKLTTTHQTASGNTGYLDEVFNGGVPDYSPAGSFFNVGGTGVPVVDFASTTDFEVRINGPFSAGNRYGIAFFHNLAIDDDGFTDTHIENNTILACAEVLTEGTPSDITGFANANGSRVDITDLEITQDGSQAVITGKIVPNEAFAIEMGLKDESNRIFYLCVKTEDPDLSGNFIRPAWLEVATGQMDKFQPPLGPWGDNLHRVIYNHNNDSITFDDDLLAERVITEDDLRVNLIYSVPKYDTQQSINRFFTGFRLSVVALKNTGESFELEGVDIPLGTVLPDQTMTVSYNAGRGFKLPPTSDKNVITAERYTPVDTTTLFGVQISYGLLLRWEYWLQQLNASEDFNSSKNKDWQHYQTAGWSVKFLCELITSDGAYQDYIDLKHETYEEWEGESTISFYRLDGTPLTKPLANEICEVRVSHFHEDIEVWIADAWGSITVEPFENGPRWLISNVVPHGSVSQNPLQPLPGELGAKTTFAGPTVTLSCLFDPSKLPIENGVSFTGRIQGSAIFKFEPFNRVNWNRVKQTYQLANIPSQQLTESLLRECCEPRKVIADIASLESTKNDITSHYLPGEIIQWELRKNGSPTVYEVVSQSVPKSNNWYSCTISWHDVAVSDGFGCYQLYGTVNSSGVEVELMVETYELFPASDEDGKPHENTIGDCRIMALYNFKNIKEGVDFTDSGIVDSIRVKGVFGKYQPNTQIDNEIDSTYRKQKIVRQHDDEYELKTSPISGKYMRRLVFMLLHENECWITDYNWQNLEYYRDEPVILSETANVGHQDLISRKAPVSAKFKSKLSNSISSYNNRNASKVPTTIVIGGITEVDEATVSNSNGTYEETFTGTFILPDTTKNIYEMVDGVPVLVFTYSHPTLEPTTNLIIDL